MLVSLRPLLTNRQGKRLEFPKDDSDTEWRRLRLLKKANKYSNTAYHQCLSIWAAQCWRKIYRTSSNSWDIEETRGYRYFTRSVIDYLGNQQTTVIPDLSEFQEDKPDMDIYGPQAPREDASSDFAMTMVRTLSQTSEEGALIIIGGFRTYESPYPNADAFPSYSYYLDDVWYYSTSGMLWKEIFTLEKEPSKPHARRGSAVVTLRDRSGDAQLLMFGGRHHDELFDDMWILDVQRSPKKTRKWKRIDQTIRGEMNSHFCTDDGSYCDVQKALESIEMRCSSTDPAAAFCCEAPSVANEAHASLVVNALVTMAGPIGIALVLLAETTVSQSYVNLDTITGTPDTPVKGRCV
ncbi:hypothetical protein Pmar_PMAR029335 [Perkinsus marinus ATCC 50983]|uniref:Kelch repeat protein n=1 Tax=Perkinsus marinus (strain ATCC 50983 / TXsc) TaxID=423536 RepID=C5KMV5_PERM5|nr:hypothetical protein Pmar_PMAR029335 [Perkinsus marinus ATCC 50983]EER14263.1 hypothetical protein Pmar_PMAR029335 [Perkinsus marinus ATCC 50983]|eukprot:XP_002782468.1 hypothetical protein Pmar_PMAR029335 [Perkinsus marinus ATCC 50983]